MPEMMLRQTDGSLESIRNSIKRILNVAVEAKEAGNEEKAYHAAVVAYALCKIREKSNG